MYLPEEIRQAIIDRIIAVSTAQGVFYRSTVAEYSAYPAYILEYGENHNQWSSSKSDKKVFMFNLYVVYEHDNSDAGRQEAEENISNAIGELYRDVFETPDALGLASGWIRASDVSWGYGGTDDVNLRMAMMQLEVTVHEDRQQLVI